MITSQEQSRFDVGVFALELPKDKNNENYTTYFNGYGVKWDYFGSSEAGGFWGIEASGAFPGIRKVMGIPLLSLQNIVPDFLQVQYEERNHKTFLPLGVV